MCPAVAGADSPEYEPLNVMVVPVSVRLNMPDPIRAPPPSCAPVRFAIKSCAPATERPAASAIRERKVFIEVVGVASLNFEWLSGYKNRRVKQGDLPTFCATGLRVCPQHRKRRVWTF